MKVKTALIRAMEGGWNAQYKGYKLVKRYSHIDYYAEKNGTSSLIDVRHALLDPAFWQALGKVEGWTKIPRAGGGWEWYMHGMLAALVERKTIEQYFETL